MRNIVNVFWTGGLDSTYLVVKLLSMGMTVQPYYLIDAGRKSLKKELGAIQKITQYIHERSVFEGQLLEAVIIDKKSVKAYQDITDAWERLSRKHALGTQYDWLARFARQQHLDLMVGVLPHQRGRFLQSLEGKIMRKREFCGIDVLTVLGAGHLNRDASLLYEHLLFPCFLMNGKQKTEEWDELHQLGFGDVAEMTWFCHHPILGLTCGHCHPCQDALHEGMAFRVSKVGYVLGAIGHFVFDPLKNDKR